MRRVTSIICSLAFAIFGIGLATVGLDPPTQTITASAASYRMPVIQANNDFGQLPLDLKSDLMEEDTLEEIVVTPELLQEKSPSKKELKLPKKKRKRNYTPDQMIRKARQDTITKVVPVYYLATYIGNKEDAKGKNLTIYEVHKVDSFDSKESIPLEPTKITNGVDVGDSDSQALR